jgi:hypothetical protein
MLERLRKHLQAQGVEAFAVNIAGIERKHNPALEEASKKHPYLGGFSSSSGVLSPKPFDAICVEGLIDDRHFPAARNAHELVIVGIDD